MPWSISDRWHRLRDRLLSNRKFLRWARLFPLTRPVARRRARALFDLCAGFVYSQVLYACVRMRLFEMLADGPLTLDDLSRKLCLSREATEQLVLAAISLDLLEWRGTDSNRSGGSDQRIGLGVLGSAMLANPGVSAMVGHHALLYADLRDPVALLRGETSLSELSRYWAYSGRPDAASLPENEVSGYSSLMAASMPLIAEEVLDAYPIKIHLCLLDVGGGEGAFLTAVAARAPHLQLMLFDLPSVAARAAARLGNRAIVKGGDFLCDPLPQGADIVSLVRVIHDHDDAAVQQILRAAYLALPDNGSLLLAEPMSGTAGAEPVGDAYFGFYLLAMGHGRPRTPEQLFSLLLNAGFSGMRLLDTAMPLQTRLILARKQA